MHIAIGLATTLFFWLALQAYLGFPKSEICYGSSGGTSEVCEQHYTFLAPIFWVSQIIEAHNGAIVALFTVVLAASTIGLWLQTKRLAEGAEDQTTETRALIEATRTIGAAAQVSAEATRRSVAAFAAKERAYLVPVQVSGGIRWPVNEKPNCRAAAYCNFLNIGSTAARVYEIRMKLILAEHLPERPVLSDAPVVSIFYGHKIVMADTTTDGVSSNDPIISPEQLAALKAEGLTLFLLGSITYRTAFDTTSTRVFAMKFKLSQNAYVPTRGDDYNFECEGYYRE